MAFRHPKAEEIARRLRCREIPVMHHAGRLRVALHGYNTLGDVEAFLQALTESLAAV